MKDHPLLLFISVLPGLLISLYIIIRDRYDREPLRLLVLCFAFGMLSTLPAIWMERVGAHTLGIGASLNWQGTASYSFIVIALSEELAKFVFLRGFIFNQKAFNEPLDGIVYAVMIGMGFASWENILYIIFRGGGIQLGILRMMTAVPAHGVFAVVMGYYVGRAKFAKGQRFVLLSVGLLLAVAFHGLYDFFIFQSDAPRLKSLSLATLCVGLLVSFVMISRMVAESRQSYKL